MSPNEKENHDNSATMNRYNGRMNGIAACTSSSSSSTTLKSTFKLYEALESLLLDDVRTVSKPQPPPCSHLHSFPGNFATATNSGVALSGDAETATTWTGAPSTIMTGSTLDTRADNNISPLSFLTLERRGADTNHQEGNQGGGYHWHDDDENNKTNIFSHISGLNGGETLNLSPAKKTQNVQMSLTGRTSSLSQDSLPLTAAPKRKTYSLHHGTGATYSHDERPRTSLSSSQLSPWRSPDPSPSNLLLPNKKKRKQEATLTCIS